MILSLYKQFNLSLTTVYSLLLYSYFMTERRRFIQEGFNPEGLVQKGKQLLSLYLPPLVPQEPTVIEIKPLIDSFALYQGRLNGKHYIYLAENGFHSEVEMESTMVHELVHQWHAEQIKDETWHLLDPNTVISPEEYETVPSEILFKRIVDSWDDHTASVTDAITEGLANFIELYICEKAKEAAFDAGDSRRAAMLERIKIRLPNRILTKRVGFDDDRYHLDGLKLITKMVRKMGLLHTLEWIASLDYDFCNVTTWKKSAKRYKHAVRFPNTIPLLPLPEAS